MVRCGPIELNAVSIDDPLSLIEVVSPSSEERDRGEKASAYMRLASLKHVCFIDRDRVHIDTFDRNDAGWVPRVPVESLDDTFGLDAIEFSMRVAEIYGDVLSGEAS